MTHRTKRAGVRYKHIYITNVCNANLILLYIRARSIRSGKYLL